MTQTVPTQLPAEWRDFFEGNQALTSTTTTILLTSSDSEREVVDQLSEDFDFDEEKLQAVDEARVVKASELHGEFKLSLIVTQNPSRSLKRNPPEKNQPSQLLDLFGGGSKLAEELNQILPGAQQVAAIFVDEDGGTVVRWNVSSVGDLHELRDKVLQGDVDDLLTEKLRSRQNGEDASSIRVDKTAFAQEYENSILMLDRLTPHQEEKLLMCQGDVDVHIQAPAGAGKTFVALHRMLEILKEWVYLEEGVPGHILFVARNAALCLFVAKWLSERLQKKYTRFRLGYLWTLLEPLGMSLVLWLVFSVLLGARALGLQPYLLFLSVAILPWWWFSTGIGASTRIWRRAGSHQKGRGGICGGAARASVV